MFLPELNNPLSVLSAMITPAVLISACGTLIVSTSMRLARIVDRVRSLIGAWELDAPDRAERDEQILRHRQRAHLVLRACRLLYGAVASFVGTSLSLAMDAFLGFRLGVVPTLLAVFGVLFLLGASFAMWREVSLAVVSFDAELDQELARRRN